MFTEEPHTSVSGHLLPFIRTTHTGWDMSHTPPFASRASPSIQSHTCDGALLNQASLSPGHPPGEPHWTCKLGGITHNRATHDGASTLPGGIAGESPIDHRLGASHPKHPTSVRVIMSTCLKAFPNVDIASVASTTWSSCFLAPGCSSPSCLELAPSACPNLVHSSHLLHPC